MARLEAQSKLLYYPTPSSVVELIASWFNTSGTTRLVDPCCGAGEALAQFTQLTNPQAETWGIEISYARAAQAKTLLNVVLPTSFYELRSPNRWSNGSVSLAFNNPPYDWSSYEEIRSGQKRKVRHEVLFIEATTPKVMSGGHHIIIIPQGILGDEMLLGHEQAQRVARHLLGWYEEVNIMRFPNGDYERFKQIVVLACNKRVKYIPARKEAIDALIAIGQDISGCDVLTTGDARYTIPATPLQKATFVYTPHDPAQLLQLGSKCTPVGTTAYQHTTYVRPIGAAFTPAMPLSIGHISMMIAGQETGVLTLPEISGNCRNTGNLLVKGMSRKIADVSTADHTNEVGEYSHTNVCQREKHVASITIAHMDGNLEMLQSANEVGSFITQYADPIADAILKRNQPLYELKPSLKEWEVTGKSAAGLPPIPNRQERGLFDVQRHFAIAAARVMKTQRHCILNAEMGFGKTSTSIAALELMNKWPALVMCPGHMVYKWQRDLERSANPDEPIVARVITRPVLSEPFTWQSSLKPMIIAAGGVILDVNRFQVNPISPNDPGGRRQVLIGYQVNNLDALEKVISKLSFRDLESKQTLKAKMQYTRKGLMVEFIDRDDYTMEDFYNDYQAGKLGRKAAAVIAFDPAKYDAGAEETPAVQYAWRRVYDERTGDSNLKKQAICPTCGKVVENLSERFCPTCHAALFNFNRWRRVGLARLVQRQYRHFFKVYVGDEIHKCQNGRSDIGTADQRFISTIRYSLALTGTLFGGTAGSLFYLLYRRSPDLRRLYEFVEKNRFVDHYGVWERTWDQGKPYYEGEAGASTGIKRWNYRQRELPGVAPAVIRFLLPITLFGNITDLGYELPPLHENVEELVMTDDLASQYHLLEEDLLKRALEIVRSGDTGVLSTWFTSVRFRPASAFRDEEIHYTSKKGVGSIHWNLPAATSSQEPWLPKEIRLAEIVCSNMQLGRKTLVFVEQTGTRDIRGRLKQVVEQLAPGGSMTLVEVPTVGVLSASDMSPAKREAWIKLTAPKMDAMLVNPKLIETGLDLVMFSDLVFYEVTTSLYTLWQAMRRVWRLGQNKEVNVTFLSYEGTMESEILRRMGLKMKFAQLLYGKEAAGCLVETDSDDLQREIINFALEGKAFRNTGEAVVHSGIFSNGTERPIQVTTAPTGSLIAVSPIVVQAFDLPSGELVQLALLPGFEPVTQPKPRRRK